MDGSLLSKMTFIWIARVGLLCKKRPVLFIMRTHLSSPCFEHSTAFPLLGNLILARTLPLGNLDPITARPFLEGESISSSIALQCLPQAFWLVHALSVSGCREVMFVVHGTSSQPAWALQWYACVVHFTQIFRGQGPKIAVFGSHCSSSADGQSYSSCYQKSCLQ